MKNLFLIQIMLLLLFSCTSDHSSGGNENPENSTMPEDIRQKIGQIDYFDEALFSKAGVAIDSADREKFLDSQAFKHKIPAERFFKKSRGYQQATWKGENNCSWAIEKYRLNNFSDRISRHGDTLVVKLKNGEKMEFHHDHSNPEQILYFQFKNYLPKAGFAVVESFQNGKCPDSFLIDINDGNSYPINGSLYFSDDESAFFAASFNSEPPLRCNNKIEFYTISNGQLEKKWHVPTGDWGATDIVFINPQKILMEQSVTGVPAQYNRYAELSLAE